MLAERARKVIVAREQGYWIVSPGEHLRLIARQFCPGDKACERHIVAGILAHNKDAFADGNPDRLRPGTRLEMPPSVLEPAASAAAPKAGHQNGFV